MDHSVVSQSKVWGPIRLLEKFLRKFIFTDTIMSFAHFCRLKEYKDCFHRGFTLSHFIFTSDQTKSAWILFFLGGPKSTSVSHRQELKLAGALTCTPDPPDRNADWSWWGSAGEDQAQISPMHISEKEDKTWGIRARWGSWGLRFGRCLHICLRRGVKRVVQGWKGKQGTFNIWHYAPIHSSLRRTVGVVNVGLTGQFIKPLLY